MTAYVLYGAGGFGRELRKPLSDRLDLDGGPYEILFADDFEPLQGSRIAGSEVLSFNAMCRLDDAVVCVTYADPYKRKDVVQRCIAAGLSFFQVTDPSARCFDNVRVGDGNVFCANTVVTSDVIIGSHFQCNIFSYVAHDCEIGDFVTFAPRVCCNGRVRIGSFAYIGTGAVIRPGTLDRPLQIGEGAIVGMGAVVTKDIEPGETVVGNPAAAIKRDA
jgi:sugar O-acyltransferase (sialic acid O-acetyltransferase NeuD family)